MNIKNFKIGVFLEYFFKLLPHLKETFIYLIGALLIGLVIGFFLTMAKLGKNRVLKGFAIGYTAVMRSLPSIVVLFLVYYGLPQLVQAIFSVNIARADKVIFVTITLALFSIATLSEIMKSAYLSVNHGQFEAAISNGLTEFQAFFRIILPQAFRFAIPNLGNSIVILLKEGSLGYTIGFLDVMGAANQFNTLTYQNHILEIYFALAAVYWVLSILIDYSFKLVEIVGVKQRKEKSA